MLNTSILDRSIVQTITLIIQKFPKTKRNYKLMQIKEEKSIECACLGNYLQSIENKTFKYNLFEIKQTTQWKSTV
jgi:hypothetical protein